MSQAVSHQPGALKQSNKKHKGSLSSKRAAKRALGAGKVSSAAIAAVRFGLAASSGGAGGGSGGAAQGQKKSTKSKDVAQEGRMNRLNRSKQLKEQKRTEALRLKRLGTSDDAPKIVGILSLSQSSDVDMDDVFGKLMSETSWQSAPTSDGFVTHAMYAKHRTRCTFLKPASDAAGSVMTGIDLAKVADVLIFVARVDSDELIDAQGHNLVSALKAVGCPEAICCLQGMENLSGKKLLEAKQQAQRQLEALFGPDVKIVETTRPELLCRQLCNLTPRTVAWKASRSFLLGDGTQITAPTTEAASGGGASAGYSAQISGFLRGKPLPVNSLVHIPGVGTCRVDRVVSAMEPFPGSSRNRRRAKGSMNVSEDEESSAPEVVAADQSRQDPLFMEAISDGLTGEQTWPTEEEMDAAMKMMDEGAGRHRRNVPATIPEGMSSYQADWFVDEEGVFDADDGEEGEGEGEGEEGGGAKKGKGAASDSAAAPFVDDGTVDDEDENFTMNGSMLDAPMAPGKGHAEKQRLRALASSEEQFPDEMDTPDDRAARERFARFRALQSFRSSPWHPKENLPREYSRIFQFENFSGVQRRILAGAKAAESILENAKDQLAPGQRYPFSFSLSQDTAAASEDADAMGEAAVAATESSSCEEFVYAGQYVHLVVDGLTAEMAQQLSAMTTVMVFGLHRHENRLSVLHFNIRRVRGYDEPIKSKESLIFHAGFRSFSCNPIFSESNLNCDKHKLERFLLHDRFSVATTYAPITFLPCPLLVFKKLDNGSIMLVATGSLSSIDPDRIILKKVILTGLPIRVRKRFGVVKHLFYDPQDVRWFKPAELVTKFGLRGHIREPVGTHGLLKAIFSGPITQNDTVMLVLYKRVFPKLKEEETLVVR